jgi:hypothetical protein
MPGSARPCCCRHHAQGIAHLQVKLNDSARSASHRRHSDRAHHPERDHTPAGDKPAHLIEALKRPMANAPSCSRPHQTRADKVARHITGHGSKAAALHATRPGQRKKALEEFHSGTTRILVATDIAARGSTWTAWRLSYNTSFRTSQKPMCTAWAHSGRAKRRRNFLL